MWLFCQPGSLIQIHIIFYIYQTGSLVPWCRKCLALPSQAKLVSLNIGLEFLNLKILVWNLLTFLFEISLTWEVKNIFSGRCQACSKTPRRPSFLLFHLWTYWLQTNLLVTQWIESLLTWLHPLQRLSTFLYLKLLREYHQQSLYPKYLYCPLSRDSVCKALTNVFLCEENISDEIKAVIEDRKFPVSGLCLATYRIPMQFTQHTIWWHNQPRIFPKVLHRINSIYAIKSWKIKLKLFQLCSSLALKEVLQKKHHCSCLKTKT